MIPEIDSLLVQKLVAQQFPDHAHLPVTPVKTQGWDNRTFRLGDALTVRLPSQVVYADAVHKEAKALAILSDHLPVPVPEVVGLGEPTDAYPLPWSMRRWISGSTLADTQVTDRLALAKRLGALLVALRGAPVDLSFSAGTHSFYRGCHPSVYADEVAQSLQGINDPAVSGRCLEIWHRGMTQVWQDTPVWFHGDLAVGNILMQGDAITALIDFGTCGVGDPACDFVMAWTYFDAEERQHFRDAAHVDDGTWYRAKAWALWKALLITTATPERDADGTQARALNEILMESAS